MDPILYFIGCQIISLMKSNSMCSTMTVNKTISSWMVILIEAFGQRKKIHIQNIYSSKNKTLSFSWHVLFNEINLLIDSWLVPPGEQCHTGALNSCPFSSCTYWSRIQQLLKEANSHKTSDLDHLIIKVPHCGWSLLSIHKGHKYFHTLYPSGDVHP